MGCKGLHCDGCHHGSPAGPAAAVLALLVIVAVAARGAWPKVVHAVEIAAWTMSGVTGAAIVITGTVLTVRGVRRARARRAARQVTYHIAPVIPAARRTEPPAIDRAERPAWLYGSGCCQNWTPEHGCSSHTGRPAMSCKRVRSGQTGGGSDEHRPR
jgi:hypothetical protein